MTEEAKNLNQILQDYKQASGQEVNFSKSAITFAKGTPSTTQQDIMKELNILKLGGFGKYLGLPEHIGRNKKEVFEYIIQRIKNKLDSWYSKLLSPAGKEVLLKAVITAIPTYTMSCFILPKTLLQEITKAMRHFWWPSCKDKHKIPWIAWDKITESRKDGGLGIRDMLAFHKSLVAKQAWRLMTCPSSLLARVYKAKYYRKTEFMEARSYQTSSYAWRSILQAQPLLQKGICWIVGDGSQVKFWSDKWIPSKDYITPINPQLPVNNNLLVRDLFIPGTRVWDIVKLRAMVCEEDVKLITGVKPSVSQNHDWMRWIYSK